VFFIVFQVAPLAWVAINSLQSEAGWGLDNFSKVFASKFYLQAMQRSLEISFWSSVFGIVIATLGATRCAGSTRSCATSSAPSPT
jgi:putative spermidine/putrescine transport system permease protein